MGDDHEQQQLERIARALEAMAGMTPAELIDVIERLPAPSRTPKPPPAPADGYERDEHGQLTSTQLFQMERDAAELRGEETVRGHLARHVLALLDELSR